MFPSNLGANGRADTPRNVSQLGSDNRSSQAGINAPSPANGSAALLDLLIAQEQQRNALLLGTGTPLQALLASSPSLLTRPASLGLLGGLRGIGEGSLMNRLGYSLLPSGIGTPSIASAATFPLSSASLAQQQVPSSLASGLLEGSSLLQGRWGGGAASLPGRQADQLWLDALEQGGHKGRTGTFPQKLHQMLTDLEKEEGGTEIASFLPSGRAFVIHKPTEFVETIMPKYFRMSRFSSFQRQLNLYEFMRITDGPDKGAHFHEFFIRGRPVLASQIRRAKTKSASSSSSSNQSNFPLPQARVTSHVPAGDSEERGNNSLSASENSRRKR